MKNIASKLGLSVVAASLLVTVSNAGVMKNKDAGEVSAVTVSKELIQVKGASGVAYNISDVYYIPSDIPAGSLSNPTFNYQISGVSSIDLDEDANLSVFEVNGTNFTCNNADVASGAYKAVLVANGVEQVSTENGKALVFNNPTDSDKKAYNDKYYYICKASSTSADANVSGIYNVSFDIAKTDCNTQSDNMGMSVKLYSGDSQELQDQANGEIVKVLSQYSVCNCGSFDAQIDPAANFTTFTTSSTSTGSGCSSTQTSADELCYQVNVSNYDYDLDINTTGGSVYGADLNFIVSSDKNLTNNISSVDDADAGQTETHVISGYSVSYKSDSNGLGGIDPDNLSSKTYKVKYTLDSEAAIPETKFTTTVKLVGDTAGDNTCTILDANNAGAWTNYGYEANIPEVTYVEGSIETVITVVNKSENDANAYFTVSNAEGSVCTIDTTDGIANIVAVEKGKFSKYSSKDIINACIAKDATFADNGSSYAVKVFVPTTPGEVFTYASFKNSAKNLFKDLPVYDNNEDFNH